MDCCHICLHFVLNEVDIYASTLCWMKWACEVPAGAQHRRVGSRPGGIDTQHRRMVYRTGGVDHQHRRVWAGPDGVDHQHRRVRAGPDGGALFSFFPLARAPILSRHSTAPNLRRAPRAPAPRPRAPDAPPSLKLSSRSLFPGGDDWAERRRHLSCLCPALCRRRTYPPGMSAPFSFLPLCETEHPKP